MRILVIGGSRGLGRLTVKVALEEGHVVTVFSRNPYALDIKHPNLRLRAGNVLNLSSLERAISGTDIIICALGLSTRQAIGPPLAKVSHVLSVGTKNILKAMTNQQVKRLVCVTAIGTGDSIKQCTILTRLSLRYGLRWLFKEKDRQELLIKASKGIDWTIIRPTALTNGEVGQDVIADDSLRVGLFTHISRADVAAYMIGIINQKMTYSKALTLSYSPKLGDSLRWLTGYLKTS